MLSASSRLFAARWRRPWTVARGAPREATTMDGREDWGDVARDHRDDRVFVGAAIVQVGAEHRIHDKCVAIAALNGRHPAKGRDYQRQLLLPGTATDRNVAGSWPLLAAGRKEEAAQCLAQRRRGRDTRPDEHAGSVAIVAALSTIVSTRSAAKGCESGA
jgi:hypothetical protein